MISSDSDSSNKTSACTHGWQFDAGGYTSIVTEWNLVCTTDILSDLSQVAYEVGSMVGEIAGSTLADHFGRKGVHALSYPAIIALGTGLAFTQTYTAFIVLRFFIAIFVSVSTKNASYRIKMESLYNYI